MDGPEPQGRSLRLLVVDDDPDDYELLLRALRKAGYEPEARRVDAEAGLRAALDGETWDLVVVDHVIPGYGGPQAIRLLRRECPDIAVVVVSGKVDEDVIAGDLRLGADDYVFKSGLGRLGPSIEQALLAAQGRLERRRAEEALHASEARYRHMVEAAGVALLEIDQHEGRRVLERLPTAGTSRDVGAAASELVAEVLDSLVVTHCNQWALQLLGVASGEDLQARLREMFTPQAVSAAGHMLGEIAGGAPSASAEVHLTRLDGRSLVCLATITLPSRDDPTSPVLVALSDITQRWEAEREAGQARERLELALEGASEGMYDWYVETDETFVDARYLAQIGYAPGEVDLSALFWGSAIHPDDLPRVKAAVVAFLREPDARLDCVYRMRHKDGHWVWVQDCGQVVERDPDGSAVRVIGTHMDITAKVEAELHLRESEARYREMIDRANEGVWSMDKGHLTTFVNRRMAEMLGYEPEEMLGRLVEDFMFPEDLPDHRVRMAARQEGAPAFYEHRFARKGGGELHALVSAVARRDEAGDFAGSFAMFTDITRRKQAEAALADSEAMMRAFFEQSLDGIMLADAQGMCIAFNPAIERISGLSADEMLGKPVWETMSRVGVQIFDHAGRPEAGVASQMSTALTSGSAPFLTMGSEAVIHDASGRERWISHSCFPIHTAAGFMIGCVISDITERKRDQEALRASEELLRGIFDTTTIGLTVVGADERIQRANPALCAFLGYTEQELGDLGQSDYVHPDDLPRGIQEVERLMRGEVESFTFETRWVRKDGTVVWGLHDCAALRDPEGRYTGRVSAVHDVSEQKAAHEALRAQRDLLATVYESAPYVIMLLDRDGRVHEINRAGETLAGRPGADAVGLLCGDVFACPNAVHDKGCGQGEACPECVVRTAMEEACATGQALSEREGTLTVACDGAERTLNVTVSAAPVVVEGEDLCLVTLADISERRRAEERVRSLAEMVDASAAAVTIHTTEGVFLYANETALSLHGYTQEEFLRLRLEQLDTPGTAALISPRIRQLIEDGRASSEVEHVTKDGHIIPLWIDARMVEWQGQPAVLSVASDLTELKAAEREVRESENDLRAVFEAIRESVFMLDVNGVVIAANETTAERLGTAVADLVGRSVFDVLPAGLVETRRAHLTAAVTSGEAVVYEDARDGWWLEHTVYPIRGDDGRVTRLVVYERDVTERRRSEERLRSLAQMVDASPGQITIHTLDGHFLYANETALSDHGYTRDEFVALNLKEIDVREDTDKYAARIEQLRANGQASFEAVHRRKDGMQIPLWVEVRLVDWQGEEAVLSIAVDQTEQKLSQALLYEQAQRLRRTVDGAVLAMGAAVEMRDPYTAGHERRVTRLAEAIGREIGLDEIRLEGLRLAGSVHDIGKIAVPAEILSKPGELHDFEFSLVRGHPGVGADILRSIEFEQPVADIVLQHHERMDGSGYPGGRRGEEILLEARIIAVADVVEAMASHRPYRPSLGIDAALAEVRDGAGTRYDRAVVDACVRIVDGGFSFDAEG
jgi:PAS domain S-box-containing protein/putative nucleotidyltransferase with HDIG domain